MSFIELLPMGNFNKTLGDAEKRLQEFQERFSCLHMADDMSLRK